MWPPSSLCWLRGRQTGPPWAPHGGPGHRSTAGQGRHRLELHGQRAAQIDALDAYGMWEEFSKTP